MSNKGNSIRIANCSGFMGDRFSAAKDMVDGGPIDVLSGDYLAEITMGGLKSFQELGDNEEEGGYAANFLYQAQQILADCLVKNIKIVVNAGGINPSGLARALESFAQSQGLNAKVAYIDGDNLVPRIDELREAGEALVNMETGLALADCPRPVKTANAYLGGWGIKAALDAGADVVIAPRTTDAALVIGAAAWKFNWQRDDYDALAGALAAGHIIECGPQACGGNYSFFEEVPSFSNMGFPIAEIYQDGSFSISKHPGTGGLVSTGTVTEQILYETSTPAYLNPDVVVHFDSLSIEDRGHDEVFVSGAKGSPPTRTHKVCINTFGGYKSTFTIPLAGARAEAKARILVDEWLRSVGGRDSFDRVKEELIKTNYQAARTNEEAYSLLRFTVMSTDQDKVSYAFSGREFDLVLGNIPGYIPSFCHGMSSAAASFMVHWPALIDSKHIVECVHIDGQVIEVLPTQQLLSSFQPFELEPYMTALAAKPSTDVDVGEQELVEVELGQVFGSRSGDKGGNANLGIWARTDAAYEYLKAYLSVELLQDLLPDTQAFTVERYEFTGIRALNFYIVGYLSEGADSSGRIDGLAKSLAQYAAGKLIKVPKSLLSTY